LSQLLIRHFYQNHKKCVSFLYDYAQPLINFALATDRKIAANDSHSETRSRYFHYRANRVRLGAIRPYT